MSGTMGMNLHDIKKVTFEKLNVGTFQSYKVEFTDKDKGTYQVSAFVQNPDVAEFEKGWIPKPEPLPLDKVQEKLANALKVFLLDSTVRAVLDRLDPQAVAQAQQALEAAGEEVK
jgi:hypothetical protein